MIRGTFRRDRHGDTVTANAGPGVPESPRALNGEAKAEWDRMVERLTASGALSAVDGAVLYDYCRLHADAERLQDAIDALDAPFFLKVSVDGAGVEHAEPKVHPAFAQLRAYRMALRAYLVEFGLTPAARSRVKVQKPNQPVSKWAGVLA